MEFNGANGGNIPSKHYYRGRELEGSHFHTQLTSILFSITHTYIIHTCMEGDGERKRKSPLELDWDKLLRQEDDEDPVLVVKPVAAAAEKKPMTDGGEESSGGDQFRQTPDDELMTEIARMKNNFPSLAANLPDRGEKYLASIKRREEELERRKRQKVELLSLLLKIYIIYAFP